MDQVASPAAPAATWELCTKLCMQNPDCESVFWDTSAVAGGGDAMCTQLKGMLDILRGLIKRGLKILNT